MIATMAFICLLFVTAFLAIVGIPGLRGVALRLADIVWVVTVVTLVGLFVSGALSLDNVLNAARTGFTGGLVPVIGSLVIMVTCTTICSQDGLNGQEIRLLMGTTIIGNMIIVRYPMNIPLATTQGGLNPIFGNSFFVLFSISIIIMLILLAWFGTEKAKAWRTGWAARHEGGIEGEGDEMNAGSSKLALVISMLVLVIGAFITYSKFDTIKSWWAGTVAAEQITENTATVERLLGQGWYCSRIRGTKQFRCKPHATAAGATTTPAAAKQEQRGITELKRAAATGCDCVTQEYMKNLGGGGAVRMARCANGTELYAPEARKIPRCESNRVLAQSSQAW